MKNYRLNIPEVFKEIKGDLCSKIFKEYDQKSFNAIYKEDFFLAMVLYDDNENKYEAYKGSTHVLKDSNLKVVPHKEGYLTYKNGSTYTGSFNMGKVHSIGRMTYPALENKEDIIAFEGQFEDGEIKDGSSTGKFFYANGTTFEGDVVDSKPHGKGKLFKGDTIIYEGEFFNGKKHGKGRLVEYDTVYEGEFENGKKCGKGTISPRVGEVVEVTFTDDKLTKVKSIIPGVDDFSYFGSEDWKFYFGEVGDAPALPAGIEQILDAPCPYYQAAKLMGVEEMEKFGKDVNLFYYEFWIDKVCENKPLKVRDTHVLTLIPKTVNRLPFTPILLAQFIIKPLQGEAMCRSLLKKIQIMNDNYVPIEKSYWVLMLKDVMPGTRYKTFEEQKKMALFGNYSVPKAIEVATSILMHCVRTGKYLLPRDPDTCTRCEEVLGEDGHMFVGDFFDRNFKVDYNFDVKNYDSYNCGMVSLRKFFGD